MYKLILLVLSVTGLCSGSCLNTVEDTQNNTTSNWGMPLVTVGDKHYYLGTFFKLSWYKAAHYCRYHGMDLASFATRQENDDLVSYITNSGSSIPVFWLSATDHDEEGSFVWMGTGHPVSFTDWRVGEGNNARDGQETENCLALYNPDGHGYKWADGICSYKYHFICESR